MFSRSWLFDERVLAPVILIRLMMGWVFMSEGIQKFLFPDVLGVGRFTRIGIPAPQFFAPFVGLVEIVCGALLIVGLLTRLASIPLLINILVAIATTKIPMLSKAGILGHDARSPHRLLHVARSDIPLDRRFRCPVFR